MQLYRKITQRTPIKSETEEKKAIKNIRNEVEMIEIELTKQTLENRDDIKKRIQDGIGNCKLMIKRLKESKDHSLVIDIKKIKAHFIELQKKIGEKEDILSARNRLYGKHFFKEPTLEIKIAHLEESLKDRLAQLNQGSPQILYDKIISKIENINNQAKVSFVNRNKDPSLKEEEIWPSLIFVTDGFSGTTREMLGISRDVLAKTTQIVYSILKQPSEVFSPRKILHYKLQYGSQAMALALKVLFNAIFKSKTFEESYGELSAGGPSALFRLGKSHLMQPMSVEKSVVVDVIVSKAERSFCQVGSTNIFIRGDAAHSSDPYSGYGCKTSLEETLADQFTIANRSAEGMNDLQMACQAWGHRKLRYSHQ